MPVVGKPLRFDVIATGRRLAVVVLALSLLHAGSPSLAFAACNQWLEYHTDEEVFPNPIVNGARIKIVPRTMSASDWQDGGAGTHLWAWDLSIGSADQFIEVYVRDGEYGSGVHRMFFGTVHSSSTILYEEYKFSAVPAIGTAAWFTIRRSGSGSYVAEFSQGLAAGLKSWANHRDTLVELESGVEVSQQCDRVDRSYVSSIQWRRQSDGLWVDVTEQNLVLRNYPVGHATIPGIAPCGGTTKFRVWINSQIDSTACS